MVDHQGDQQLVYNDISQDLTFEMIDMYNIHILFTLKNKTHIQPQRETEHTTCCVDVDSWSINGDLVTMCTVFVWDSFSQTMQNEELDTVYKSKDLL